LAALEYRDIHKNFGAVVALKGVSLSVEKGEIRALLGGNGSGKSTLARITSGVVGQTSGEVWFDGQKLDITSPEASRKYGIAVTSQELSLFPSLTLVENLSLLNVPKKLGIFDDKQAARERALVALERVGLAAKADTRLWELPDNEKYMVEFAKAILFDPKILIVDEITSALRREEVAIVGRIMKEMAAEGCCILFISHRMNEIFDLCDSITVLRNGELINTHKVESATLKLLLTDMIGQDPFEGREDVAEDEIAPIMDGKVVLSVKDLKIPGFADSSISFELHEGEVLAIAGLQGQGQTQLLRMLYGMYGAQPMEFEEQKFVAASPEKTVRKGIGFLSGDRVTEGVFVGRSIGENSEVVNNLVLKRKPFDRDKVLKQNNVKYESASKPIETLSGGNQQKVVVSRWMSVTPKVLLADDPTKGIDVAARFDVHDMMDDLAARGSGIIFVSSDEEELVTMSHSVRNYSVAVMYEGNVVKRLRGKEINITNIISASMPAEKKEGQEVEN